MPGLKLVMLAGTALGAVSSISPAGATDFDLNGLDAALPQAGSFNNQPYLNGSDNLTNSGGSDATLTEGGGGVGTTYSGTVTDGATNKTAIIHTGGQVTFTGANSFSGGTSIYSGTVILDNDTALGSGTVSAFDSSTLGITSGHTIANDLLFDTSISMYVAAGTGTWSGLITDNAVSTITKTGLGTLVLSDSGNTIVGGLTLTGGIVRAGATDALGTAAITFNGGTLQAGANISLANNTFILNGVAATIDTQGFDLTVTGPIVDSAGPTTLTKQGAGTLILDNLPGFNTYTSATVIQAGTLQAGNVNVFSANSAHTLAAAATLDLNGFDQAIGSLAGDGTVTNNGAADATLTTGGDASSTTFGGVIEDGATNATGLFKTGAGTMILTGTNTYTGGTTIDAGTLQLGNGGATGSIVGDILDNGLLTVDRTGTLALDGDISGSGGLLKIGAGLLVLGPGANNTYTGRTDIVQGQLEAAGDFALSDVSAFRVNKGAGLIIDDAVDAAIGSLADGPAGGGTVVIGPVSPSTRLTIGFDNTSTTFSGLFSGAGEFDKFGTGTLTLIGRGSTLGEDVFVVGGVLHLKGASLTVGGGVAMPNGRVEVTDGADLVALNPIKGIAIPDGSMLVDGAGSSATTNGLTQVLAFVLPSRLTISGGAVFNSRGGADIEGAPGATATAKVTGAGSTWNVDNDLLVGCFCGSAVLSIANGGVVNSSGDTLLAPLSTLNLGLGGKAGTIVTKKIENDGEIVADFTDTSTLAASISGAGTLTKKGSGKLILSADSLYTGATLVDGGVLSVNGSIVNSFVTVGHGGTLGGNGVVGTTFIKSGGAVGPGNSVGTLTVKNSLTFGAGSKYLVEVGASGADRIKVAAGSGGAGKAVLSGGSVVADFLSTGNLQKRYTILTAAGGRGGTKFTGVTDNAPGVVTSLSYDPHNVYLDAELALNQLPGLTINQKNVADTLVGYFNANGTLPLAFATLDPAGLTVASGELGTGAIQSGFEASDRFLDVISDRFVQPDDPHGTAAQPQGYAEQSASGTGAADAYGALLERKSAHAMGTMVDGRWKSFGAVYGAGANVDGDAAVVGSHDLDTSIWGLAAGAGWSEGDVSFGAALGGGHSNFDVDGGLGSGDAGIFNAGVYGRADVGQGYVLGAVAYGYHDVSTSRVAFGETLAAGYGAHSFSGRAEAGYRFDTAWAGLTPYVAFQGTAFHIPAYGETGGAFALNYEGETASTARGELGIRLDRTIALDTAMLKLSGRAAWAHASNDDRSIVASFQTLPGTSFTVYGADPDDDSALVDLGAAMSWQNGWSAALAFQGQFSGNYSSYSGSGKLSFAW